MRWGSLGCVARMVAPSLRGGLARLRGKNGGTFPTFPGQASPAGSVAAPSTRRFTYRNAGAQSRANDTEVKLLEWYADRLTPDSRGVINLYTIREPCPSCGGVGGVIEQFEAMFPHVKVNVTFSPPRVQPRVQPQ